MFEEQWKKAPAGEAQAQLDYPFLLNRILTTLQQTFQTHGTTIPQDYQPTCLSIDDSLNPASNKSCKSTRRVDHPQLLALQELLAKQLWSSLAQVVGEVFEGEGSMEDEDDIQCLIAMQSLLRLDAIRSEDRSRVLKWIYELCSLNVSSMELCNLLASIKKKLLRLGFSLLDKKNTSGKKLQGDSGSDGDEQEEFKGAVEDLIQAKQAQISGLKFQLCRVCQAFMPINLMASHLNQCERIHQQQYLQNKLDDKGGRLLTLINQLPLHSEHRYNLRNFFDRVYTSIGDVLAAFALRGSRKEIGRVIEQWTGETDEAIGEVVQLLTSYQQCLEKQDFRDNLSDKQLKAGKGKIRRRNRCSIGSNTSLIPSFHTVQPQEHSESSSGQQVASQKTINTDTEALRRGSLSLSDFQVLQAIGKGSYSEVFLVRKRNTQDLFAMKVIQTQHMDEQHLKAFKREQKIYKSITGGFNVKLYYSFGQRNLYFLLLDYGQGGSLRKLLEEQVYFDQKFAKVYMANLILAVDCIHRMGIVHRDLKPDNIVINEQGQLILTDFNLSKLIIDRQNERHHTFFGTPDYIAPQVLRGEAATPMIDYFSLGVIAYEMTIGVTPYTANSPQEVFENTLRGQIEWPEEGGISRQCKSILQGLLDPDPKRRLGANGFAELQTHPFFNGVNWTNISQNLFFFVPGKKTQYPERSDLLEYIKGKMREQSEGAVQSEMVVRYDILKTITNKNLRSQRSSRFKLQKELEALRLLPSMQNVVKLRKHNSYNNFGASFEETLTSCRQLYQ